MMTPEETDALIVECSEAELGVHMFVGKLKQLNAAGMDLGVTPEILETVLLMINHFYGRLVVPPEGAPN
ncbi:hypothetical protein [Hyphomicrobium sp.]|uniref:hypothetical protein n=1 Tax=Hyphomicrobium sp. TaxID=82 RepID=UPI0025C18FD0|nr:hypothetical protein [Hyphomicrobium sp.]MCC7251605.1 hypothetical protein [Hyphomicrobium sp.]